MISSITTVLLVGQTLFANAYGGEMDDGTLSIATTQDGGYLAGGLTVSFGVGYAHILALKLSNSGSLEWARTYGPLADALWPVYVTPTLDGGFVIAGSTNLFGAGRWDFLLLKISGEGDPEWVRTYGGAVDDLVSGGVLQIEDGGFVITGVSSSFGPIDFLIIKTNGAGDVEWAKTYGGDQWDWPSCLIRAQDAGFAVLGGTNGFGAGSWNFLLVKLNIAGDLEWARIYGTPEDEEVHWIVQTPDLGYALAGYAPEGAGFLIRTDPGGDLKWAKKYDGSGFEHLNCLTVTPDGGFLAAGRGYGEGLQDDIFLLKISPDGEPEWTRVLEGPQFGDVPYALLQAPDGGYLLTGYSESFGAGLKDAIAIKTGPEGEYPDCLNDTGIVVSDATLDFSPVYPAYLECTPIVDIPDITVGDVDPVVTQICETVGAKDSPLSVSGSRIIACPVSGGIILISSEATGIKLYSSDGRLSYSGMLEKGENRLMLDRGVYFWSTENQKGKAVVR